MECFAFPFCTCYLGAGMWFLSCNLHHLLWNTHEMCHLSLRLVVMNMAIAMDAGCSGQCLQPQHHIKWMRRYHILVCGLLRPEFALGHSLPTRSTIFGPHLVKVRSEMKSSMRGIFLGHILSKSSVWQHLLMRGTFLGDIWSKSTAWYSPLMTSQTLKCLTLN